MTNENEDDFVGEYVPLWARVLFCTLHIITSLNGVLGCGLILNSLITNRLFRSASCTYTVYLGNLVILEIYLEGYHFPLDAVGLALGRLPVVNEVHCIVTGYLAMACHTAYLLTLTSISFDRYMRVCHGNMHRKHFSWKTSMQICLFIWVLSLISPIPGLVQGQTGFDSKLHDCFLRVTADHHFARIPYLTANLLSILLSAFFSIRIFSSYRLARRRVNQHPGKFGTRASQVSWVTKMMKPSDLALLRSLLVIYMCLIVLVIPLKVVTSTRDYHQASSTVQVFLLWLLSVNTSLDWIVYGLLNTRFRDDYRRIFARCRLCIRPGVKREPSDPSPPL